MAKNIEPNSKKSVTTSSLRKTPYLPFPNTSVRILGGLRIVTSCGKTSIIMLRAKAKTDTSLGQLSLTVKITTPSTD